MGLFYKNNGAISVFLCLILLPVLIFSGMTVDASRIYMAKVVISDAGEMALNAGLAQYNEALHDEYGFLATDRSPESMSGKLEEYFTDSLNGSGLPDAEDYQSMLDLLEKNFEALSVANTEIYRTEVEKQQILEYMKYRAPVCLTELVLEKIAQLRDTKKKADAMEAEMEFVEDMEDCQDAFEEALEALNSLNRAVNGVSGINIQTALDQAEAEYKGILSKCLLMRAFVQSYDQYAGNLSLEQAANSFIQSAKKVNFSVPYSETTFETYITTLYYKNTVDKLGGIDKLLSEYEKQQKEKKEEAENNAQNQTSDSQDQGTDSGSGSTDNSTEKTDERKEELQKLTNEYKEQVQEIEGYPNELLETANQIVKDHYSVLNGYLSTSKAGEIVAKEAYDRLKEVKKKLEDASKSFADWDEKTNKLKEDGKDGGMAEETDKYRDFFSNGEGSENLQLLDNLMEKVKNNEAYFRNINENLEKEKFYDQSLASVEPSSQMNRYIKEANSAVSGKTASYMTEEDVRKEYTSDTHYIHIQITIGNALSSIEDDPFYQRLKEYCESQEKEDSSKEEDAANENTEEGLQAAQEASGVDDSYPTYNWAEAGVTLPSVLLSSSGGSEANANLASADGDADINSSGARRDAVNNAKNSMSEASSFLTKVDEIVTGGLENLYIAEYAMQMFSYYTVDKEDGETRAESDIISISGYPLSSHAPYRGECEYILWGDASSQNNVRNTVMLIFGIRMLFNSFFALSNHTIRGFANTAATAIAGAAPYLVPIVQVVIQLGLAGVETALDLQKIKQGYGVTIVKNESTWVTFPSGLGMRPGDNTSGVTLDYSEYLRVFLNISILTGHEQQILARIADCIQVNEPDVQLSDCYTMVSIIADVKVRTTFMRKISDYVESDSWGFPDDYYTVHYESLLGY